MASIYDLCPEILQIIFAKIEKMSQWQKLLILRLVSKYWRLNIDGYLATKKSFQITGRKIIGSSPPQGMNYYQVDTILSFHPNLKRLKITNFTVSDHLVAILRHRVPTLEKLELKGVQNLTWRGITILSVRFDQLEYIDVTNCELDENRLSILVENLQNLKTLTAINPGKDVTGQCLDKLGPKIEDLWIGFNQLFDCNSALKALVSGNGKKSIHLGLAVNNLHLIDLAIIVDTMPQLKSLKLTFNSIKRSSLKEIAKLLNLEFLVLAEHSINDKESVLTDETLIPILKGCPKLTSINLAGSKENTLRVTNQSISQIPRLCSKLEQIRFSKANNIDDQCLTPLADMQKLYVLHFSSTNNITTEGIKAFAKQSKSVRNFRADNCPKITEEIIPTWIDVANNRSTQRIILFLDQIEITQTLEDLPKNLKINYKKEG